MSSLLRLLITGATLQPSQIPDALSEMVPEEAGCGPEISFSHVVKKVCTRVRGPDRLLMYVHRRLPVFVLRPYLTVRRVNGDRQRSRLRLRIRPSIAFAVVLVILSAGAITFEVWATYLAFSEPEFSVGEWLVTTLGISVFAAAPVWAFIVRAWFDRPLLVEELDRQLNAYESADRSERA